MDRRTLSASILVFLTPLLAIAQKNTEVESSSYLVKLGDYKKNWRLDVGFYYPTLSTTVQFNSSLGEGTEVKFEDDLELSENKGIFEAMLTWNFARKWYAQIDYISLGRTSTGVFDQEIVWGDPPVTYQAGALFGAKFDATIARLALGYNLFDRDRWKLALTAGLHWTQIEAGVRKRVKRRF